jgi:hypothetical protein
MTPDEEITMFRMKALFIALTALLALDVAFPPTAWAYLDPGTGSMIIQALLAVVLGISFTFKMWWHRLLGLFRRKSAS